MTAAPASAARARERTCIVTRAADDPDTLIRFVRTPDGTVAPDLAEKLPGRGAWVRADRKAIETAAARGLFARAFKASAQVSDTPQGFAEDVADLLRRRILSTFGLARRAGAAIVGYEKAHAALKAGKAAMILSAADAAEDGAGKLARLAAGVGAPSVRLFSTEALSMALGFDGARHVAIVAGPHGDRALRDLRRLAGFQPVFAGGLPREEEPVDEAN